MAAASAASTPCVDVCPVDAFCKGPNFLLIDPEGCIDCIDCAGLRARVPGQCDIRRGRRARPQQHFTALDAELARVWKPITRTLAALPDAQTWPAIEAKLDPLQR